MKSTAHTEHGTLRYRDASQRELALEEAGFVNNEDAGPLEVVARDKGYPTADDILVELVEQEYRSSFRSQSEVAANGRTNRRCSSKPPPTPTDVAFAGLAR